MDHLKARNDRFRWNAVSDIAVARDGAQYRAEDVASGWTLLAALNLPLPPSWTVWHISVCFCYYNYILKTCVFMLRVLIFHMLHYFFKCAVCIRLLLLMMGGVFLGLAFYSLHEMIFSQFSEQLHWIRNFYMLLISLSDDWEVAQKLGGFTVLMLLVSYLFCLVWCPILGWWHLCCLMWLKIWPWLHAILRFLHTWLPRGGLLWPASFNTTGIVFPDGF